MKFGPDTLELDAIDRQVLTELQADAKISLKDIGEKVGLAAPSVMERVRKMEQAGIITGYHAVVDKQGLYDPQYEQDSCGVGFVADIQGRRSHQIVLDADQLLRAMDHRGACGCETNTGDGAGLLTALPIEFLRKVALRTLGSRSRPTASSRAGNVFLPTDAAERRHAKRYVERQVEHQGQRFLGWREVPVDPKGADIGPTAVASLPHIEQLFVGRAEGISEDDFNRQLFIIRKSVGNALRKDAKLTQAGSSTSARCPRA
jgi:glutamate synthase (NADPH/NADH) large chain